MLEMEDCLFCKIIQGVLPVHKIWEDEHFLAILDIARAKSALEADLKHMAVKITQTISSNP